MPVDSISFIFNTTMSSKQQTPKEFQKYIIDSDDDDSFLLEWRTVKDDKRFLVILHELQKYTCAPELLTHICKYMLVGSFAYFWKNCTTLSLNSQLDGHNTALQIVCSTGGIRSDELADSLIHSGANPEFAFDGKSPLELACGRAFNCKTPLELACERRNYIGPDLRLCIRPDLLLIETLLQHGCKLTRIHLTQAKKHGSYQDICSFIERNIALTSATITSAPVTTELKTDAQTVPISAVGTSADVEKLKAKVSALEAKVLALEAKLDSVGQAMNASDRDANLSILIKKHAHLSTMYPANDPDLVELKKLIFNA